MKHSNSGHSFPTPSFQFVHSKVETPSTIFNTQRDQIGDMNDIPHPNNSIFCLTHLEIITCPTDSSGSSSTAPYVMGVFSIPIHALDNHNSEQNGSSSVIVRWQLDTTAQNLHASFDDVVSKKPKVQIKVWPSAITRCLSSIEGSRLTYIFLAQYRTSTTRGFLF